MKESTIAATTTEAIVLALRASIFLHELRQKKHRRAND